MSVKRRVLIIVMVFILLAVRFLVNTKEVNFTVEISAADWASADLEFSALKNREDFISEVLSYIENIGEFTSNENWYDIYKEKHGDDYVCGINFKFTSSASHVEGAYKSYDTLIPTVYLNKDYFEHDLAPTAHETAHIMFPNYSSLTFREGFAGYCQDKFGKNPSVFNWGADIHAITNYYMHNNEEDFGIIFALIGTAENESQSSQASGKLRTIFYNTAYSFSKYLIETYGIEKFTRLYGAENLMKEYQIICGKPLDGVKEDWRGFLEKLPETDFDEIEAAVDKVFAEHNY